MTPLQTGIGLVMTIGLFCITLFANATKTRLVVRHKKVTLLTR